MFFPQLEINMDWRQNCLIDSRISFYTFYYISLSLITADLVAAGLRGVTFLFPSFPSQLLDVGGTIYLFI